MIRSSLLPAMRIGLAVAAFVLVTHSINGQDDGAQQADAELNAIYRQVLAALPAPRQQMLRAAERAWIAFCDKNATAFLAAGRKRGMTAEQIAAFNAAETVARCNQLRLMIAGPTPIPRDALRAQLNAADASLNAKYQQALARLAPDDQTRLRDAQRAWIAFRDQNARIIDPTAAQALALAASLQLTMRRSSQLGGFYLGALSYIHPAAPTPAAAPPPTPPEEEKVDPSIPDPFERAR